MNHRSENQYSRYYVHRSDAIGYFVLRDTTWHDTEVSTMVDYLAAPDMLSDLFAAAVVEARRRNKAALLCTTLNRHANKTLPWLGFVRLPHASYATRFMLRADRVCEHSRSCTTLQTGSSPQPMRTSTSLSLAYAVEAHEPAAYGVASVPREY